MHGHRQLLNVLRRSIERKALNFYEIARPGAKSCGDMVQAALLL
jgi:hypothetical protein